MGSLFMIFVAMQNFQMADALGNAGTHAALRAMAGQLNQLFFVAWERAELGLGVVLTALLLFGNRRPVQFALALTLLALVAVQHFGITPRMLSLSAHLDNSSSAGEFARLHAVYGISEVLKLILAFLLAVLILPAWRPRQSTQAPAAELAKPAAVRP